MSETEVNEPAMARPTKEEELLAVKLRKATTRDAIIDALTLHVASYVVSRAVEDAIEAIEEAEWEEEIFADDDED